MIPNNDPLYKTSQSKVQRFAPFVDNIKKEKDDLKKTARQYKNNNDRESVPHSGQSELYWDTVKNKMDKNLSREEIQDRIKSLEDDSKETDHKYKIVKSYEGFQDEMTGVQHMHPENDVDPDSHEDTVSYMFFGNLETIHNSAKDIMSMDHQKVNELLNQGHNWAEDHISVTKENLSHVYNFLKNRGLKENNQNENYMFFANIESIHRMCEELGQLDEQLVDDVLTDGHDWAEDHMSAAKECITQVEDFLKNELM